MLILRFDFRRSDPGAASMAELYSAALEMAEWADDRCRAGDSALVMFSQHHGSPDGYLPSPMVMAAAAAARTTDVPISVGALLLLMYDPVKLAEDMIVLDHLSGGRVSYTIGLGYRAEEYAMFGVDPARRGALMEERLDVLRRALTGEQFTWEGRTVHVTPGPLAPGGPVLAYGGNTPAAARRAARFGLLFLPGTSDPSLADAYDAEAERVGNPAGIALVPPAGAPNSLFVADDVDAAWDRLGPYLLHDARAYAEWMGPDADAASLSRATTVEELRSEDGSYRIVTPTEAAALRERFGALALQPLCGGIPPDLAWPSLRRLETIDDQITPR